MKIYGFIFYYTILNKDDRLDDTKSVTTISGQTTTKTAGLTLADMIKEVQDKKKQSLKQTGVASHSFDSIKTVDNLNSSKKALESHSIDHGEMNSSFIAPSSAEIEQKSKFMPI